MKVTPRLDNVLELPTNWDSEAMAGNYPKQVLDYLKEQHPKARLKQAHTTTGRIELPKQKSGRALLIVRNTEGGAVTQGKDRLAPNKGSFAVLDNKAVVIEHTYSGKRLVLEYSI